MNELHLPIKPVEALCNFATQVVPALKDLKGLHQSITKVTILDKKLGLYCGKSCATKGALHFGAKLKDGKKEDRCPNPIAGETIFEY